MAPAIIGSEQWYTATLETILTLFRDAGVAPSAAIGGHLLWMAREQGADTAAMRAYLLNPLHPPPAAPSGDMIDLAQAQIVNSPDVRGWPATAVITTITVTPNNVVVEFTKKDGPARWPDQKPSWTQAGDTIQYTVWLFLRLGGTWVGAGFIQMWHDRDGVGDAPSDFVKNWYYPNAWAPMTGHVIAPGESIALMVTAGDARNRGNADALNVHERSNVVTFAAPAGDTGIFSFA